MDGGEYNMVKNLISVSVILLSIFALSFNAFCAEYGNEYYEEYDNYEEFENDYVDNYVVDSELKTHPLLSKISFPMLFIGAAVGAGTTLILLKKYFSPPQAQPYFRKPSQKSEIISENDSLTD